jgi:lipid-A-disaccharide synthase-like uncharacterized protein
MKINWGIWIVIGFVAQGIFSARFIVQWIVSEKKKKSTIPKIFWYLSLAGSSILLVYALHRKDPVFILGQGVGIFIYIRNLMLWKEEKPQIA